MNPTTTKTRRGYESIYPNFKRKKANKTAETQAKEVKKQLGKYAVLGAATAMAAVVPTGDVTGQIVYSGVVNAPNTCASISLSQGFANPLASTPLDVDNDGVDDFSFNIRAIAQGSVLGGVRSVRQSFYVSELGGNGNGVLTGAGSISKMPNGSIISGGGVFITASSLAKVALRGTSAVNGTTHTTSYAFGTSLTMPTTMSSGNKTAIGYIGIEFDISGSTHYGWIQVQLSNSFAFPAFPNDLNSTGCITIIDYAYESTAGVAIAAGAMPPVVPGGGGGSASIPTVSEWGMMTLMLLMMSFGTLLVYRREEELATGTMSSSWKHVWQNPIFDWGIYQKAFMGTAALAAVLGLVSVLTTGTITAVDMIGASIAGPIFAYLAHLMLLFIKKK